MAEGDQYAAGGIFGDPESTGPLFSGMGEGFGEGGLGGGAFAGVPFVGEAVKPLPENLRTSGSSIYTPLQSFQSMFLPKPAAQSSGPGLGLFVIGGMALLLIVVLASSGGKR